MSRPQQYDVVIAGGGPAGLSAAMTAAQSGLRVAVLERSKEIGYPIHTSGGSWIEDLRRLGIPDRFMHPIRTGRFLAPAAEAIFHYDEPVSCILDVRGLYQHLAVLAAQAGAEIFPATRVEGVILDRDKPCGLRAGRAGKFFAPLLIDATGMAGLLARELGLREPPQRYGLGAECDVVAGEWPADTVALLVGSLVGPAGYGWIFPHADNRVRIGVGLLHPDTATPPEFALQALLEKLRQGRIHNLRLSTAATLEYHTGAIPAGPPLRRTSAHGLLVVGDAAGLISTLVGEGIRFVIELGRLAGTVAVEAHRRGRFDAGFLARYDRQWRARYGRLFQRMARANRRLAGYTDETWNEKIQLLAHFPAAVLPPLLRGEWHAPVLRQALWQNRRHLQRSVLQRWGANLRARARRTG
ncbi:MAG: NAD(P)/FAD-dependent oxidoreductase [candidate division KSB1 bacterium]|nr:NAD(P)/FAD-dependent oxidoreductase [candidate division KSB1 bacterium]MDZ7273780.1 NAD(P)/FAD-dependent oxidoreductase [candidate division KSB1 bacterium]MDZ7285936.1 NAD(P)/FAD-dependent oxidoreductase [candidate division KSB1 bacterium]MDZ7298968.1 NAD(P)/FAD-dependent oxidoreductase [candidate division KSB1 bacterium]MDZ7308593.1 NAD(P)/FAD-dependent oxidoreductase [candidate division KSB1 bacterium]